jgi:hypothetical protein
MMAAFSCAAPTVHAITIIISDGVRSGLRTAALHNTFSVMFLLHPHSVRGLGARAGWFHRMIYRPNCSWMLPRLNVSPLRNT